MLEHEILNHWRFFLSLEKDMIVLGNYIEIHENNFAAFSFELSKILQLSCSEIDCVCRLLCATIDPSTNYQDQSVYGGNIKQYRAIILNKLPRLPEAEVSLPTLIASTLRPWNDWTSIDSPAWWKSYNKVKHYRHTCFAEANLKNALDAMAALMIAIMYLYRVVVDKAFANPSPGPTLFDSPYTSLGLLVSSGNELPGFE